jgi:hypothetical protein
VDIIVSGSTLTVSSNTFCILCFSTLQVWDVGQLSQYSVWLRTGRPGFDPRQRQNIFPLTSVSRPALGPTQPPVQWVPGALSPAVKRGRGVMLTTHPLLVLRLRKRSYTSSHRNAPLWSVTEPLVVWVLYRRHTTSIRKTKLWSSVHSDVTGIYRSPVQRNIFPSSLHDHINKHDLTVMRSFYSLWAQSSHRSILHYSNVRNVFYEHSFIPA